eukprot:1238665-Alexandrium_andersonii.AAC.1
MRIARGGCKGGLRNDRLRVSRACGLQGLWIARACGAQGRIAKRRFLKRLRIAKCGLRSDK